MLTGDQQDDCDDGRLSADYYGFFCRKNNINDKKKKTMKKIPIPSVLCTVLCVNVNVYVNVNMNVL